MNNAAPEGRNSIVPVFNVPPLRGWCGSRLDTHGSRRGLQTFRRSAANRFLSDDLVHPVLGRPAARTASLSR